MFNKKLKELREKAGLSQQELSEKLFVSRRVIAKWESGKSFPGDANLESICSLFKVSKDELCDEEVISKLHNENKYKKILIISIILLSTIIIFIVIFSLVKEYNERQDLNRFNEEMRKELNEPVKSFGNIEELYQDVINSNLLTNSNNVFLNNKDFYVVKTTSSKDIVKIIRYNYEFIKIKEFNLFLHSGYNTNIIDIKTLNNNDILIACNHYNNDTTYNDYSSIIKLDESYNIKWEYTFTELEYYIKSVYEYNNKFYVFADVSQVADDSVSMANSKILVFTSEGEIDKETCIVKEKWGFIDSVSFSNGIFYVGCLIQENHNTIFKTFEYDNNLNCINEYIDNKNWNLREYKSSEGIKYYNIENLKINNFNISKKYGILSLCLNLENGKLLIFENKIDYDWEFMEKNPYISYIPFIIQNVYLYIDNNGNALWCKGE